MITLKSTRRSRRLPLSVLTPVLHSRFLPRVGYTTETFLTARADITVVAFDPLHYPYVGMCMNQISERYHNRFMLMGGIVKETIELLSSFLGSKRFDMIYIDSGSYPTTARTLCSLS